MLIVSSDHGEAFGEHDMRLHAKTIYEELVRAPLLVRGPRMAARRLALLDRSFDVHTLRDGDYEPPYRP